MASLKKETLPSGVTRWRARYVHQGKQREKAFRTKSEAEKWIRDTLGAISTGNYSDPVLGRRTVGELAADWLTRLVDIKPKTLAFYEQVLVDYVLPRWGSVPVAQVTTDDISKWVVDLVTKRRKPKPVPDQPKKRATLKRPESRPPLSASSARHAHRVLALVLELAITQKRIVRNPASGVKLPRLTPGEPRYLTRPELLALANAAGQDRDAILFLANTGLRMGEFIGLRAGDFDPVKRQVNVVQNVTEVNGVQVVGTPKGRKGRPVPVPAFLVENLTARAGTRAADEPLFTSPSGGRLRIGNFRRRVFTPACRAAGISGLRLHDLRHTAASLAVSSGGNVKAVQRMLGHASAAMTLDIYAGLFTKDLDDLAAEMDRAHRESEEGQAND